MIVADASALIAFLSPDDALHGQALAALLAHGPAPLLVSPITHAEILVGPARAGTLDATQAALGSLRVREVVLPADCAARLARLRASTGLKLPDCCVLLAAQQSACGILSFDERLTLAAGRLGLPES